MFEAIISLLFPQKKKGSRIGTFHCFPKGNFFAGVQEHEMYLNRNSSTKTLVFTKFRQRAGFASITSSDCWEKYDLLERSWNMKKGRELGGANQGCFIYMGCYFWYFYHGPTHPYTCSNRNIL
jgi:hypothetical protein